MKHHVFSRKSEDNLEGVHPDLIKLIYLGLEFSPYDIGITCGPRSVAEQKHLVDSGKSWTMDSKHLYQSDGFAHAVDFVVYVNGKVSWDIQYYRPVVQAIFKAAIHLGIQIEAGALWRTVVDGPHVELA